MDNHLSLANNNLCFQLNLYFKTQNKIVVRCVKEVEVLFESSWPNWILSLDKAQFHLYSA